VKKINWRAVQRKIAIILITILFLVMSVDTASADTYLIEFTSSGADGTHLCATAVGDGRVLVRADMSGHTGIDYVHIDTVTYYVCTYDYRNYPIIYPTRLSIKSNILCKFLWSWQ